MPQTIRVICLSEEAADLIEEAIRLNDRSDVLGEIHTGQVSFLPAKRNTSLYWDKELFYSLEDFPELEDDGRINSYRIEKRKMRDARSGNVIEYELFRSPALGIVNKITAIEYLPDNILEISEYYFENDGTLNFVFVHKDTSYTPSRPAAPNIYGNRYYFEEDVMVKWRTVDASGVRDIAIGENERANSPARYPVTLYSEQEQAIQNQYDSLEKMILNKAYTTYFTVLAEKQTSRITGRVTDHDQNPLANVSVTLIGVTLNEAELFRTFTDDSGSYTIHVPPGDRSYALIFERKGDVPVRLSEIDVVRQDVDTYMETIRMVPFSKDSNTIRMLVTDAVNRAQVYHEDEFPTEMLRISGAEIRFREGIGNLSGNVIRTENSDRYGVAETSLPPGAYTAEILMFDYESTFFSVYSYPNCPAARFYLSPVLGKGEMRVVLTWAEDPQDLDAHLFTPFVEEDTGTESHIWFRDREDDRGNRLDVDATIGYGPETVTVSEVETGLYKYYVTDFTSCIASQPSSDRMASSSALVQVYSENGLIDSFHVPTGKEGVIWEVFEIRNRSIVPIHRYYSSIADKPWWNTDKKE
ncbi:MAG: carboxypeptidase regulatory-like domain-containing protein [Clostridiales bacterium]|nr:carboxypeptidase regulatory-like domain-containing protein [Clostridiales bacterium]